MPAAWRLRADASRGSYSAPAAALLATHAAWSGEEEHALLASQWALECCANHSSGVGCAAKVSAAAAEAAEQAAEAPLHAAAVLSGADRQLSHPRIMY